MGLGVRALSLVGAITTSPTSIAVIGSLLLVANLVGWFPGVANDDSDSQYVQAVAENFNDWHPPIWLGYGPSFDCLQTEMVRCSAFMLFVTGWALG